MAVFIASTISEKGLRVLDAVLRRHEERVGGHVVDEDEVPLRRVREVAAGSTPTALARLLRCLAPAARQQQPCRRQRATREKLPAA
jgi:hypothetical protein